MGFNDEYISRKEAILAVTHDGCTANVVGVLYHLPTADVAPKSEVDKWYHEYHVIKDKLKQEKDYHRETEKLADRYFTELQEAKKERDEYKKHVDEDIIYVHRIKSEVAREVIEEIFLRIKEELIISELGKSALNQLEVELKKKYTEPAHCKDCKYLMFSDCYGECAKGYKGIVNPDDTCGHGAWRN